MMNSGLSNISNLIEDKAVGTRIADAAPYAGSMVNNIQNQEWGSMVSNGAMSIGTGVGGFAGQQVMDYGQGVGSGIQVGLNT